MANLRVLRRAEADYEDAEFWYTAQSPAALRRFEKAYLDAIERITAMPRLYALIDDILRVSPIRNSPYLLVYRYDEAIDEVVVTNITHAKRGQQPWQQGD